MGAQPSFPRLHTRMCARHAAWRGHSRGTSASLDTLPARPSRGNPLPGGPRAEASHSHFLTVERELDSTEWASCARAPLAAGILGLQNYTSPIQKSEDPRAGYGPTHSGDPSKNERLMRQSNANTYLTFADIRNVDISVKIRDATL